MRPDQFAMSLFLDDLAFLEEVEEIVAILEDDDLGFDPIHQILDFSTLWAAGLWPLVMP